MLEFLMFIAAIGVVMLVITVADWMGGPPYLRG